MKYTLKNSFSLCLSLVLSTSFTLPSFAEEFNPNAKAKRLGLMTVVAPNPVEPQKPEQFFVGTPPATFTDGVLYHLGLKRRDGRNGQTGTEKEILARVEADKNNKYLVPFAVIDTGVDPSVADIRSRMHFDVVDGKIVGSGYDYLSDKPWGIPYIQDPWMYAIGASEVNEDFLIKDALNNPISYLSDLNERVMTQLSIAISGNPALKNSFFAKLNSSNTNMIGLIRLLQYEVNPQMVDALSKAGKLISPSVDASKLDPMEASLLEFSKSAWLMSPDAGLPDYFANYDLEHMHGLGELQTEISKILNKQTILGQEVFKNFSNLNRYFSGHHFPPSAPPPQVQAYTLEMMSHQIAAKKLGTQIYHPSFELLLSLRQMKSQKPGLSYDQIIDSALTAYDQTMKWMLAHRPTFKEASLRMQLQGMKASLPQVKNFILSATRAKSYDDVLKEVETTGKLPWIAGESSLNRKYAVRALHPGLHSSTMSEFHGSHVATTARAYSNEDFYRILSYRIGLGMVSGNETIENYWVKKNIDAMYEWFKKPVVAQAIFNLFTEDSKMDFPFDVKTEAGRLKLADFMKSKFVQYHERDASASGIVGQALHWNIVDIIKDLERRKVPVANLSIGGHFEQPENYPTIDTAAEKIGSSLDFIFGEFQKYTLAEAVSTHGKHTMFFIATGNSNNFGDAEKLSNYPADLRSPWLARAKGENVEALPGEKLGNIIGVMSLNPKSRTSNFSNLILTDNEIYLIRGENIRASSMSYTMENAETAIRTRTPEIYSTGQHIWSLRPDDPRVQMAMQQMNMTMEEFHAYRVIITQAIAANIHTLKIQYNDKTAEISGTSMATPSAAALALVEYHKQLKAHDITNAQAYGKKRFRPRDINAALKKMSTPMTLGTKRLKLPSLRLVQKNAEPSALEIALKNELDRRRATGNENELIVKSLSPSTANVNSCSTFYNR